MALAADKPVRARAPKRPAAAVTQKPAKSVQEDDSAAVAGVIRPHLATLVDRLLELSEGVWQLDEDGKTVYQRAPDRKSIEYLIDRALGRPTTAKVNDGPVAFAGTVTVILPDNSRR